MKKKACCKSAPIPGETKVWQYVTLTTRIYLIDCPGVVYDLGESETDKVLKGIIRAEKLEDPAEYIDGLLKKVKQDYLINLYGINAWTDYEDFLTQIAKKNRKTFKRCRTRFKSCGKNYINGLAKRKNSIFCSSPK